MFCGRLKIPPSIMALTITAARAMTPSFFSGIKNPPSVSGKHPRLTGGENTA